MIRHDYLRILTSTGNRTPDRRAAGTDTLVTVRATRMLRTVAAGLQEQIQHAMGQEPSARQPSIFFWGLRAWLLCGIGVVSTSVWMSALGEPIESRVLACAGIGEAGERLACYDALVAKLEASQRSGAAGPRAADSGAPVSETSVQPSSTPTTALEASSAMFGLKGRAASSPGVTERDSLGSITARIMQLRQLGTGGVQLKLDNGQTWEQLGSRDLKLKTGEAVRIARAAFGSFWLSTPDHLGARVRRLR
jgi:hypothetical protein